VAEEVSRGININSMQAGPGQSNSGEAAGSSLRAAVIIALAALLVFAAIQAIGLARADFLFSSGEREAVERAAAMEPDNARYRVWLAELLERAGEDPRPMLREAATLKPDDDAILIRLGLREEAAGRLEQAEALLLDAARVSQKYEPRWTLANFYFRRGNREQFWRWAREALGSSYGDRTPLFRLSWEVAGDPATILREAIPDQRPVRLAWLRFLIGQRRFPEVAALAGDLAAGATEQELNPLLGVTDALLGAGDYTGALNVWNLLCARQLISAAGIDPVADNVVTNGDFARPTLARGFAWRIPRIEGVFVTQALGTWSISLTGGQPERREIMSQPVPLEPGMLYRFTCRYRTRPSGPATVAASSGLRWRLRAAGGRLLGESEALAYEGAGESIFEFQAPEGVRGARLVLDHQRASGSMRMEGSLELEEVRLNGL